jgi:transcriptional regulator with XRE-family HTH domain
VNEEARWAKRQRAFGQRVAALRHERGMSQEALADAAGIHRTYVGQLEGGRRNVALRNLYRLADALDVSICDLVG